MFAPFGGADGVRVIRVRRPDLPLRRWVFAAFAPWDIVFAPLHTVIVPHRHLVTAHGPVVASRTASSVTMIPSSSRTTARCAGPPPIASSLALT
ncbi:hypothetical protein [Nocardia mexicana]|uniref:hypothetical protein n=1 Tax=Nocardia mexicana TaxID=279262 RepID=UPI000A00F564|nr:hypothetical protein [Nocardia mexicana]